MRRTTDQAILKNGHYRTDEKLRLRKAFNSFAEPSINLEPEIIDYLLGANIQELLDVGCGNGDLLIKLRKAGFKRNLTGMDLSEGIMQPGITASNKEGLNINFFSGQAEQLDFAAESFDAIIAKHMLYHLANPQKAIDEMHRCLRPQGSLIISLNSKYNAPLLHECEELICQKFGLSCEHGQQLINLENLAPLLGGFDVLKEVSKEGKIRKPEMFPQVFASFRDNYYPPPDEAQWKEIMAEVENFMRIAVEREGELVEIRRSGLIIALKNS